MPPGALSAAYALHMAATAIWIGGLFSLVVILPAATSTLDKDRAAAVSRRAVRRFLPLAWLSLAIFVGTGLTQMSASPRYEGLLVIGNAWAGAILAKHVVIAGMAGLLSWQTWGLQRSFTRAALGLDRRTPDQLARMARHESLALTLSLLLGTLVIILTAVARSNA